MVNSSKDYYSVLDKFWNLKRRAIRENSNLTSNFTVIVIFAVIDEPKTENKLMKRLNLVSPMSIVESSV